MAKDLSQLKTDVQDWIVNASAELTSKLDTIVNNGLRKMYREMRVRAMNFIDTSMSLTSGNGLYTIPMNSTLIAMTEIVYISSNSRVPLIKKDITYCNEYWPDRTQKRAPKYYCEYDDTRILITPTPDASYSTEQYGRALLADLATITDTNWIITNHYDVALAFCIREAAGFVQDDRQVGLIKIWDDESRRLLDSINQVAKRIEGDQFRRPDVDKRNAPAASPVGDGAF